MNTNSMLLVSIRNYSLLLFVVCFFFFPRLQTIFVGLSFAIVLTQAEFYSNFWRNLKGRLGVSMLCYFGIICISLIYTSNLPEGIKSIETKFSFLAFPIFLPFIFKNNDRFKNQILNSFVIAGIGYVVLSFLRGGIWYYTTSNLDRFFYGDLGVGFFQEGNFLHPTYASLLFNFLISYLSINLINGAYQFSSKSLSIILLVTFSLFILLLSSKFGILALGVNFLMILVYFVKRNKKIKQAGLLLLGFALLTGMLITQTPLKNRFEAAYMEMTSPSDKGGSTKTRKEVWNVTLDVISENPILGVGTGDIRDVLSQKYKERNYRSYVKKNYDSHQQFLQTFAATGVFGFLALLLIFVLLFRQSIIGENYVLLIFTTLFFLFGLIESMLERQTGITFFAFFGLFLYFYNPSKIID